MTITAQTILNEVSLKLQDTGGTKRFAHADMLKGLNEAERAVIRKRPGAYTVTQTYPLAAGAEQSIPAGAIRIVDFVCNMGTSGATPGLPLNRVDRRALESCNRLWFSITTNATVLDVAYEPDILPKTFWVSPPQPGSGFGQIKVIVSKYPAELVDVNANINLADEYKDALITYVLAWVFEQETEEHDYSKAKLFYDKFGVILS